MTVTDTLVHPYPDGNSSIRRMALEAGSLGFDSIAAPVPAGFRYEGIDIIPAVIISETDVRKVSGALRKRSGEGILIFVDAGENGFNRAVLNLKGIHILRQLHRNTKKSFDHTAARIAADRGVAIDIDLYPLIHSEGHNRQRVLQRYRDIITLHSHYHFQLTLSSNSCSVLDQKSVDEIALLCRLFGMDDQDVRAALGTAGQLLEPEGLVRVIA